MAQLELSRENINAVSIELTRNKKLFEENVNYVLSFMFKTFEDKNELLSKIKVLNINSKEARRIDAEAPVIDQIAMNVFAIKKVGGEDFFGKIMGLFRERDNFSKLFLIHHFKSAEMDAETTGRFLKALGDAVLDSAGVSGDYDEFCACFGESADGNVGEDESGEGAEEEEKSGVMKEGRLNFSRKGPADEPSDAISLVSLNDSEEISRMDQALGAILEKRPNKRLSEAGLHYAIKGLALMEEIVYNSGSILGDAMGHVAPMLCIMGCEGATLKRAAFVLRKLLARVNVQDKKELFEIYCYFLERNAELIKLAIFFIEYCSGEFAWERFYAAVDENENTDLGLVDRSKLEPQSLYDFVQSSGSMDRYAAVVKGVIAKDTDVRRLEAFDARISERMDEAGASKIKAFITRRLRNMAALKEAFEKVKVMNETGGERKRVRREKE
jgi:hypothetical protein